MRFGRIATVDLKSSNTGENGQVIYRMIVLQITIWIKIRLFECRDSKDVPHRQQSTCGRERELRSQVIGYISKNEVRRGSISHDIRFTVLKTDV